MEWILYNTIQYNTIQYNTIKYKHEYYYSGINPVEFRGHCMMGWLRCEVEVRDEIEVGGVKVVGVVW